MCCCIIIVATGTTNYSSVVAITCTSITRFEKLEVAINTTISIRYVKCNTNPTNANLGQQVAFRIDMVPHQIFHVSSHVLSIGCTLQYLRGH